LAKLGLRDTEQGRNAQDFYGFSPGFLQFGRVKTLESRDFAKKTARTLLNLKHKI
jgi:hypothetical protein